MSHSTYQRIHSLFPKSHPQSFNYPITTPRPQSRWIWTNTWKWLIASEPRVWRSERIVWLTFTKTRRKKCACCCRSGAHISSRKSGENPWIVHSLWSFPGAAALTYARLSDLIGTVSGLNMLYSVNAVIKAKRTLVSLFTFLSWWLMKICVKPGTDFFLVASVFSWIELNRVGLVEETETDLLNIRIELGLIKKHTQTPQPPH